MSAPASSLQEQFAPESICYGCGPANAQGLHVRSFAEGSVLVAEWTPAPHHEAFPGMLNGGIIGTLLDCHCNWCAAHHLMQRDGLDKPPCTVTAEYTIRMRKPTPTTGPVRLRAWVVESADQRVTIEGELEAGGRVTATCRGLFVAVEPGHPAYHRW
jgi:acyl-coenzyme A thioesterase PaaI-like protein